MTFDHRPHRYRAGSLQYFESGNNRVWAGVPAGSDPVFTGQNPTASRYRFAYQLSDVIRMFILWL